MDKICYTCASEYHLHKTNIWESENEPVKDEDYCDPRECVACLLKKAINQSVNEMISKHNRIQLSPKYRGKWVQFKFPKTKKKRIRRKWAKNKKNFRIEYHRRGTFPNDIDGSHLVVKTEIAPQMGYIHLLKAQVHRPEDYMNIWRPSHH